MDQWQDAEWDKLLADVRGLLGNLPAPQLEVRPPEQWTEKARATCRHYFRSVRPGLRSMGTDEDILSRLDSSLALLLSQAEASASTLDIAPSLARVAAHLQEAAIRREHRISDITYDRSQGVDLEPHEQQIYDTLYQLVPSAARSYRQAILDLSDTSRISYRGPANELREALREVLDHLAPDNEVTAQKGFQLEEGTKGPTRKQKARYILRARGLSGTATKVPEDLVETIEEKVAAVVSATYSRANNDAHVQTEHIEVIRTKRYLDAVLSELLALPSRPTQAPATPALVAEAEPADPPDAA